MSARPSWFYAALWAQSIYYLLSGALPLVSMSLFESLTGPKTDLWLVRMVALLAVTLGVVLGLAAARKRIVPETIWLSVLAALSFATIDVIYVLNGTIRKIYLADAAIEVALAIVILVSSRPSSR